MASPFIVPVAAAGALRSTIYGWCAMSGSRIIEILDEIGQIARTPHVRELAAELGTLLATELGTAHEAVDRLRSKTTLAIIDTELTLDDEIKRLRVAITELHTTFVEFNSNAIKRREQLDERNEKVAGRIHTLSNHMMAVESKVNELAEVVTILADQIAINNAEPLDDLALGDVTLTDPYAT